MKDDQPSGTARLIARSLLMLSQDPDLTAIVPPHSEELGSWFLEACGENPARFRLLAGRSWFRRLLFWGERIATPGLWTHYALRKRAIEEAVRQSLAAGAQQVVVLGAGFDTLAWRLHREFPTAAFWELDHPATQRIKRTALAAHAPPGARLQFAGLDLASGRLSDTLRFAPMYRAGAATVFVAEGLLMYLMPEQVSCVFQEAYESAGPDSRFVFTFLEPQPNGRVGFARPSRIVDWWLRRRGEPFQWGLGQAELGGFLDVHGWTLQAVLTPLDLRARYLAEAAAPRVVGDLIGLADWKVE